MNRYALACLGLFVGAAGDLVRSEAHALELTCTAPTVYLGDARPGSNPVTGVYVNHDSTGWTVLYRLADGEVINRAAQYDMRETSNAYRSTWAGRLHVQPWLIMIGEITRAGSGLGYHERIIDQLKGEAVTMDMATDNCAAPSAPVATAPAAAAPSVIVNAPAPADNARLDEIERKLNDLLSRPAPAPAPASVAPVIVNAPSAPSPAPVIINNAPAAPAPAAPPIIVNAPAAPAPSMTTVPAPASVAAPAPSSAAAASAPIAPAASVAAPAAALPAAPPVPITPAAPTAPAAVPPEAT